MAQAANPSIRFHNLSNEALADEIGHADALLKGAEAECKALIDRYAALSKNNDSNDKDKSEGDGNSAVREKARFPLLAAYDLCLKCSHLFNLLDARGAISVTERVGIIARIRVLAVGIAKAYSRMIARTA